MLFLMNITIQVPAEQAYNAKSLSIIGTFLLLLYTSITEIDYNTT